MIPEQLKTEQMQLRAEIHSLKVERRELQDRVTELEAAVEGLKFNNERKDQKIARQKQTLRRLEDAKGGDDE